jgi:hypothetical protein
MYTLLKDNVANPNWNKLQLSLGASLSGEKIQAVCQMPSNDSGAQMDQIVGKIV